MATNLFSTYSTGENRVTASILAVLQSLSLRRTERILGALMERLEFELVHGRLGVVVDQLLASTAREEGNSYKVMLLSPPEDPRTLNLGAPIPNDLVSKSGRTTA